MTDDPLAGTGIESVSTEADAPLPDAPTDLNLWPHMTATLIHAETGEPHNVTMAYWTDGFNIQTALLVSDDTPAMDPVEHETITNMMVQGLHQSGRIHRGIGFVYNPRSSQHAH
jgi:hypothetical protein